MMRPVIVLEMIGDDYFWHKHHCSQSFDWELRYMRRLGTDKSPSWLARLVGIRDDGKFERKFMDGARDYSRANSTGSRGIFVYYPLADGVYEINDRYHWKYVRHYFARVENSVIQEISREEVMQCLTIKKASE